MRINHPRHQRRISEINHLSPCGSVHMRSNRSNPVALHQHLTRRNNPSPRHVKHARCMEHHNARPIRHLRHNRQRAQSRHHREYKCLHMKREYREHPGSAAMIDLD
jgi:hypothetical protein